MSFRVESTFQFNSSLVSLSKHKEHLESAQDNVINVIVFVFPNKSKSGKFVALKSRNKLIVL